MRNHMVCRFLLVPLLCFVFFAVPVQAVDYVWVGGASGAWDVTSNWNPAGIPGSNDTITVTNPCALNLNGNRSVYGAIFCSNGNYSVSSSAYTLSLGRGRLVFTGDGSTTRVLTFSPNLRLEDDSAFILTHAGAGNCNHAVDFGGVLDLNGHDWFSSYGWAHSTRYNGAITGTGNVHITTFSPSYGTIYLRASNSFSEALYTYGNGDSFFTIDGNGQVANVQKVYFTRNSVVSLGSASSTVLDSGLMVTGAQGRVRNDAQVFLRMATLYFYGQNSTTASETLGLLETGGGYSCLNVQNGSGGSAALHIPSWTRNSAGGGVTYLSGNYVLGAGVNIFCTNGVTALPHIGGGNSRGTDRKIVPYIVGRNSTSTDAGRPNSFVRYDMTNGFVPLATNEFVNVTAEDYVATSFPAVHADGWDNVRVPYYPISGQQYLHVLNLPAGDTSINSLFVDANAASSFGTTYVQVQVAGGSSLTIRSGAMALSGASSFSSGPGAELAVPIVKFGENGTNVEGVISYFGNGNVGKWILNSSFVGTRGLTIYFGNSTTDTTLSGNNSGLSGPITIGSGGGDGVTVYNVYGLGAGTNPVYLGHNSELTTAATISGGRSLTIGSLLGHGKVTKNQNLNIGGDGTGGLSDTCKMFAGGRIAPGDSDLAGRLTLNGFTTVALAGGTFSVDLFRPRPYTDYAALLFNDQLAVSANAISLGASLELKLHYAPQIGDVFKIVDFQGPGSASGTFAQGDFVTARHLANRYTFDIHYASSLAGGDGNDIVLECRTITADGTILFLR